MKNPLRVVPLLQATAILLTTGLLTACGGSIGTFGQHAPSAPPVDESLFASVSSYCQNDKFPVDGRPNSLTGNMNASAISDQYILSSYISTQGYINETQSPLTMHVPHSNYRGVTGDITPSGYGKPAWVMGIAMPPALAPHASACVTQVARIDNRMSPQLSLTYPYIATPPVTKSTLYWRSFWNTTVPVQQLQGYLVDGFEFVSDFVPADGQVYFILDKARFSTPQSMSLCFLAPKTTSWDCKQPSVADQGENWQVFKQGLKPGVYVLTSPTLQ